MNLLRIGLVGVLLAPYAVVMAQGLSTIDLVKGNYGKFPTSLKLADLPDGYSAVKLSVTSASSDPLSSLWPLMGIGRGGNDPAMQLKYKLAQCVWTNGEAVRALNREFLVTYRLDVDLFSVVAENSNNMGGSTPAPKAVEPALKISLVALDSIQGVSPSPELTKKDLLSAYGTGEAQVNSPIQLGSAQSSTLSNVKQAALGLMMYTNDYDDAMPYVQSSKAAWYVEYPYVKTASVFKTLNPKGGMLRYNMGISGALSTSIAEPAATVMIYESEAWPDGRRAVAFCDGHAKLVTAEVWAELSKHLAPTGLKRVGKPLPVSYDKEFDKVSLPHNAPSVGVDIVK